MPRRELLERLAGLHARVAGRAAAVTAGDHVERLELALMRHAARGALTHPRRQIAVHQAPGERRDHTDRLDPGEVLAAAQPAGHGTLAAPRGQTARGDPTRRPDAAPERENLRRGADSVGWS